MESLTITERTMPVPVNHMDGAGIFLPSVFPQSCQIRGGWIKGAVFPFDFRRFIIEKQEQGKAKETIKDAWGYDVSVDYIRDNIKIILNDSQLKMRKYYKSWEEYKFKLLSRGDMCQGNRKIKDFFEINEDMRKIKNDLIREINMSHNCN